MIFFLLRVILVSFLWVENAQGVTEQEKRQALMLWREKKILFFEQPLPRFPIIESTECLSNAYDLKNCLHPFSFFCKELNSFYIKRLVKYSCLNVQGCEFQYEYIQKHFDRFDPITRKLTEDDLPWKIAEENFDTRCEGAWYDRDYTLDATKDLIVKLATSIYSSKEKRLNPDGVLLSDDFFYLFVVLLDHNGDRLVLFHPYRRPLFTDEVFYRLADCFMRFI